MQYFLTFNDKKTDLWLDIVVMSYFVWFFTGQLLPTVFTHTAWGILHTLLEMFSYRLHHTQPHYRIQLLSHLHHLSQSAQTNQNQLQLW